jgi:hypothetical protein
VPEDYRSYVVRVRRRRETPETLRIEVEDLLGGRRNTVVGEPAEALSDGLRDALADPAGRPTMEEPGLPSPQSGGDE